MLERGENHFCAIRRTFQIFPASVPGRNVVVLSGFSGDGA
jgi:hypothetical protein